MKKLIFVMASALIPVLCQAGWSSWLNKDNSTEPQALHLGNRHSQSFYTIKKEMLDKIYYDRRRTLYCDAHFTRHKQLELPQGFVLPDLQNADFKIFDATPELLQMKANRLEWEHIVPAQNFGKMFPEWYDGKEACVSKKGKKFKGRACAEQESEEFRYMYTDMYNLYPVIGAVNHLRAHFNFTQFTKPITPTFGVCGGMVISKNKVEPRDAIKGFIARTYLYMQTVYPRYRISDNMAAILNAWDRKYPGKHWECQRAYRIEKVQGNANPIVKPRCQAHGMYWDIKD